MQLVTPSLIYQQSYFQAIEESLHEVGITLLPRPVDGQSFEDFVQNSIDQSQGKNLPRGYVPSTEFWLIKNGEFIGRTNIRHTLNEFLLKVGGHIGYWIRPSKRGMGYGKMLLQLALAEARKMGISKVLVTCDITNDPSRRVIEANGGKLENVTTSWKNNPPKRRYWFA